jgi:DNA-directed RNA polymerase subunit omega
MIYPSIDKILNIIDSKYKLVHVISKRVFQIKNTGYYQMKEKDYKSTKDVGRVLEEIAEGLIHIK